METRDIPEVGESANLKRFILGIVICLFICRWGGAEEVLLATLEWPPYISAHMPGFGGSAAVVRAAFAAEGIQVRMEIVPWKRAMLLGTYDHRYVGYFPAYEGEDRNRASLISRPIGTSPLGFAQLAGFAQDWHTLDDWNGRRVGIVTGYINTKGLDDRIQQGNVTGDAAPSDELNLIKLLAHRMDAAVIDRHVFDYLLATSPELSTHKADFVFSRSLLEEKPLFVYFQRNELGARLLSLFNRGLAKIDIEATYKAAVSSSNSP